mgnify:CR=1 FL=1
MAEPFDTNKAAISQGYDAIAGRLRMSPKFYRLCTRMLIPRLPPEAAVVDLGCGEGHLLAAFAASNPQLRFSGLDLSAKLCELARQRVPGATVIVGDLENLPFPPEMFDAASMTEVLEHLLNPQLALKQVFNILKPGGWLLLTLPNRDWFRYARYQATHHRYQPVDDHWYSVAEARQMLTADGFTVRQVRGAENLYFGGGLPHLLEKLALAVCPALQQRMKRALFLARKPLADP